VRLGKTKKPNLRSEHMGTRGVRIRRATPSVAEAQVSNRVTGRWSAGLNLLQGRGGSNRSFFRLAERVGFEPTVAFWTTHALQACLIGHSSTSPCPEKEDIDRAAQSMPAMSSTCPVAERVGFEPTLAETRPLFESGTINHSDTSPRASFQKQPP
jgi:hypothetical protein